MKNTIAILNKNIETEKATFNLEKTTGKISTTNFWRY